MYCVDGFVHVLYILHFSIMHCGFESAINGSIAKGNLKKHIRAITANFRQSTYSIPVPVPVHYSLSIVKQKFTA